MQIKHIIKNIIFEDYRWSPEYQLLLQYKENPSIYVRFFRFKRI